MRRRLLSALCAACALALLAGCGISDPYNDRPATTTRTSEHPGMAPPNPDDPPPPPPKVDAARLPATPRAAIARYVELAGTWDWRTIVARYRALAPLTVDAARTEVEQIVTQIPRDPRYATQRVRQRTTLEAALPRGPRDGDRVRYLVVQQRRIEIKAAPPSSAWVVTLVTLRAFGDGWAVERWEDQG